MFYQLSKKSKPVFLISSTRIGSVSSSLLYSSTGFPPRGISTSTAVDILVRGSRMGGAGGLDLEEVAAGGGGGAVVGRGTEGGGGGAQLGLLIRWGDDLHMRW